MLVIVVPADPPVPVLVVVAAEVVVDEAFGFVSTDAICAENTLSGRTPWCCTPKDGGGLVTNDAGDEEEGSVCQGVEEEEASA